MTYNGWKNYETWNVALWIDNDEGLYRLAQECKDYDEFLSQLVYASTPDGVAWRDSGLDVEALDDVIRDTHKEGV
jgi:hypothetical protein